MEHVHACHCFDIPFPLRNFDKWAGAPFLKDLDPGECSRVSEEYSRNFASFMKTGRPDEDWKKYDENEESIKVFT